MKGSMSWEADSHSAGTEKLVNFITAMDYPLDLLYLQEPVTRTYRGPLESHPHTYSLCSITAWYLLLLLFLRLQSK